MHDSDFDLREGQLTPTLCILNSHTSLLLAIGSPTDSLQFALSLSLSSTGSILSNTDLSDLSTVGTCDIFVYQMRHRVM